MKYRSLQTWQVGRTGLLTGTILAATRTATRVELFRLVIFEYMQVPSTARTTTVIIETILRYTPFVATMRNDGKAWTASPQPVVLDWAYFQQAG